MRNGIFHLLTATTLAVALSASSAYAQKKYDTRHATDTEIKIGQTVPFSGPASAYSQYRQDPGGVFQDDQCAGRHQRPQDQSDPV